MSLAQLQEAIAQPGSPLASVSATPSTTTGAASIGQPGSPAFIPNAPVMDWATFQQTYNQQAALFPNGLPANWAQGFSQTGTGALPTTYGQGQGQTTAGVASTGRPAGPGGPGGPGRGGPGSNNGAGTAAGANGVVMPFTGFPGLNVNNLGATNANGNVAPIATTSFPGSLPSASPAFSAASNPFANMNQNAGAASNPFAALGAGAGNTNPFSQVGNAFSSGTLAPPSQFSSLLGSAGGNPTVGNPSFGSGSLSSFYPTTSSPLSQLSTSNPNNPIAQLGGSEGIGSMARDLSSSLMAAGQGFTQGLGITNTQAAGPLAAQRSGPLPRFGPGARGPAGLF